MNVFWAPHLQPKSRAVCSRYIHRSGKVLTRSPNRSCILISRVARISAWSFTSSSLIWSISWLRPWLGQKLVLQLRGYNHTEGSHPDTRYVDVECSTCDFHPRAILGTAKVRSRRLSSTLRNETYDYFKLFKIGYPITCPTITTFFLNWCANDTNLILSIDIYLLLYSPRETLEPLQEKP